MNQTEITLEQVLNFRLVGLKRLITYTASESDDQRKNREAVNYSTLLDYGEMTVLDLLDWDDEIIKIRHLQAPIKRGVFPPKEFKVRRKGTRGAVQMTDEAALMQIVQGDQARYDSWVKKYGSAKAAVAKARELMAQMNA